MASDVTYDGVRQRTTNFASIAEAQRAGIENSLREAQAIAEQCQSLEVDAQSLGELADLVDALADANRALARVHDLASAFPESLARRHGQLNEAHQSAPVRAAKREMYEN
jgi:pyruvate-formate lyase